MRSIFGSSEEDSRRSIRQSPGPRERGCRRCQVLSALWALSPSQDSRAHCSGTDVGKYLAPVASHSQGVQSSDSRKDPLVSHPRSVWAPWQSSPAGWLGGQRCPPPTAWLCAHCPRPAGGWGCSEGLSEEPGEAKRVQRSPYTPCPIGWEYFCPRIRSLLKFVISLLLLPTQKTAKV